MIRLIFLLTFLTSCNTSNQTAKIVPTQLTCEYLQNPSIIDVEQPRLSWINIAENNERNQFQTAWQVKVASTKENLAQPDLWDSKKVNSNQSTRKGIVAYLTLGILKLFQKTPIKWFVKLGREAMNSLCIIKLI